MRCSPITKKYCSFKIIYMKQSLLLFATLLCTSSSFAQSGKFVTVQDNRNNTCKLYVDYSIIEFAGTAFTAKWSGASKSGFAEGKGILSVESTTEKNTNNEFHINYSGSLLQGKKSGQGSLMIYMWYESMAPYFSYTGSFLNDEMDGYGEMEADWGYSRTEKIFLNVTKHPLYRHNYFFKSYKGIFKAGKIADAELGEGKTDNLTMVADEVYYKGGIKNGMPDGEGDAIATMNNAVVAYGASMGHYKGGFAKGKLFGQGKLAVGLTIEEGNFENNLLNGKGKRTYNKFIVFAKLPGLEDCAVKTIESDFVNGESNGQAVIYFQDCDAIKLTGFTQNDKINGTCVIEFLDGSIFRGNFRDNLKSGRGFVSFSNGDNFEGEFKNNKAVSGKITYKDGSWYEGEFGQLEEHKNGRTINTIVKNGSGTMHEKDGRVYKVTCINDDCTIVQ
jgi:hypothetical protein